MAPPSLSSPPYHFKERAPLAALLLGFFFLTSAFDSPADQPVPIQEILDDPDAYHLQHVIVEGTVFDVQALPPYFQTTEAAGVVCYGAYRFTVDDGTGSLHVDVLGFCGVPLLRKPVVADGDAVRLKAQLHAPGRTGHYLTLDGHWLPAGPHHGPRAVAVHIRPAEP